MGLASATESYAASALYTTLASLSGLGSRIRRASLVTEVGDHRFGGPVPTHFSRLGLVADHASDMRAAPRERRDDMAGEGAGCADRQYRRICVHRCFTIALQENPAKHDWFDPLDGQTGDSNYTDRLSC
jgi:hypothetical protein